MAKKMNKADFEKLVNNTKHLVSDLKRWEEAAKAAKSDIAEQLKIRKVTEYVTEDNNKVKVSHVTPKDIASNDLFELLKELDKISLYPTLTKVMVKDAKEVLGEALLSDILKDGMAYDRLTFKTLK